MQGKFDYIIIIIINQYLEASVKGLVFLWRSSCYLLT